MFGPFTYLKKITWPKNLKKKNICIKLLCITSVIRMKIFSNPAFLFNVYVAFYQYFYNQEYQDAIIVTSCRKPISFFLRFPYFSFSIWRILHINLTHYFLVPFLILLSLFSFLFLGCFLPFLVSINGDSHPLTLCYNYIEHGWYNYIDHGWYK